MTISFWWRQKKVSIPSSGVSYNVWKLNPRILRGSENIFSLSLWNFGVLEKIFNVFVFCAIKTDFKLCRFPHHLFFIIFRIPNRVTVTDLHHWFYPIKQCHFISKIDFSSNIVNIKYWEKWKHPRRKSQPMRYLFDWSDRTTYIYGSSSTTINTQ